jgi:hypothetical protein
VKLPYSRNASRIVGLLHLTGPDCWPDHLLSYETGDLLAAAVVQVRGWAVGFELQGRHGNPWLNVYLGPFAFEAYLDLDRSWQEEEAA